MAKYLFQVSYTSEGLKGLLKEGGSSRVAAIRKLTEGRGGKIEAFYFAFGKNDAYVIADLPDATDVAAASLGVSSSGAVSIRTVVLLTPEQIDEAAKKVIDYRPPGA
jgi:uncharacterized protein with GYD domain